MTTHSKEMSKAVGIRFYVHEPPFQSVQDQQWRLVHMMDMEVEAIQKDRLHVVLVN